MDSCSVSAIVPVYNVSKYLNRCVDSLTAQTVPFSEIILVDDGSTDESSLICDQYAARCESVKVIHKRNGGLSSARNAGIAASMGEYIAFIDSDDWVSENYVEVLLDTMLRFNADIVRCEHARCRSVEEFDLSKTATEYVVHEYSADEFLKVFFRVNSNRCIHYAWDKLYKRSVLEEGHFPEGMLNEDVEGCFKALCNSAVIAETDAVLYAYFVNNESITGSAFGENYLSLTEVWRRLVDITALRAPGYTEFAEYNLRRSDFTVLCDSILHGSLSSDSTYSEEISASQKRLRRNLRSLLRDPMQLNRKVAAVIVAIAYFPIRSVARAVCSARRRSRKS